MNEILILILAILALLILNTICVVFILIKGNLRHLFRRDKPRRKVFVDTSALMDGRILTVAQTGFLGDDLLVPRSVIRELQLLADGKDEEKRARARSGMSVFNELERVQYIDAQIYPDELDKTPVDERLLQLAKMENGMILTMDFNLMKVAETEKITTLNLNDLVIALQPEFKAGEKIKVKITAVGSNNNQGVGHLPDGVMVVVENAKNKVGKEVEVVIKHFLQTSSGRMAFADLVEKAKRPSRKA